MKPAAFDYQVARSPQEAVAALVGGSGEARVLAGGQSLILEMNFRRECPGLLVDINRIPELAVLEETDGGLRVGALVRHREFERPVTADPLGLLLSRISTYIAHPPIRALGTMVGSLAYAHPSAEWCAAAVTLDASVEMLGREGARTVPAGDFFRGPFETACGSGELITAVHLPFLGARSVVGFAEQRRTQASFAQVAAIATMSVEDDVVTGARIGLASVSDRPLRAREAEECLLGAPPSAEAFAEAGRLAALGTDPRPEPHASVAYQQHAAGVLVQRALRQAAADLEVKV